MTMDFSSREFNRLKQAMLLGLAQIPLPQGSDALAALSLVATRSRFSRPVPPPIDARLARAAEDIDPARLLPATARAALLRLFTGKEGKTNDAIAFATMRAIKTSRLRLHPFDYARLENFIAQFGEEFGPEERSWLQAVRPGSKPASPSYDDEPVDETNLAAAGKAQKLAFLKDLRQRDPAKALDLIQQLLPNESANNRAELIGLVGIGLSEADKGFLESIAADRAQSVREAAALLLARLPGTSAHRQKLAQLKDRIEAKKAGLLRRRMVFSLRSSPKPNAAFIPLHALNETKELFEGLKLADIAALFEVTADELISGSSESPDLGHLLLRSVLLDEQWHGLEAFAPLLAGDIGHHAMFLLGDLLPRLPETGRKALLNLAFQPGQWSALPSCPAFVQLYGALNEPLPGEIAAALLGSRPWREAMQSGGDEARGHWAEAVAPLIPRPLSEKFLTDVETHSRRAALYHRFLLTLPEPADMRT
jgi:hypothetical protein